MPESTRGEFFCFSVRQKTTSDAFCLSSRLTLCWFCNITLAGSLYIGPRHSAVSLFCVLHSSSASRAQRASARNMNSAPSTSDPLVPDGMAAMSMQSIPDSDPLVMAVDSDDPSISRSNSGINLDDNMSGTSNGKTKGTRKDKGKGKEVDKSLIRVKEEEELPSLSPDPVAAGPVSSSSVLFFFRPLTLPCKLNEDHCSACAYMGSLVYCDGCPRAYHLWCLDPPMEATDVPEGDKWFCSSCTIRKVRMPSHCNIWLVN